MNPPEEWTEDDLSELIALKQEESVQLEFKRAESLDAADQRKKTEISKDVSAFANSAGGTIVYGIAESSQQPSCAESFSPIDPVKSSKDWLEQVIQSRIQPRVHGIVIRPIELRKNNPGQYVYVVSIPQSETAHQASDNRYYKRFNFQSVAMEDYEVRQTMSRTARAAYRVKLEVSQVSQRAEHKFFTLVCVIENISELVGRDVSAVLFAPKHIITQPDDFIVPIGGADYSRIPGMFHLTSPETRSAIDMHPMTPYRAFFGRELRCLTAAAYVQPLKTIVRVYDQFGLAQATEFSIAVPGLNSISSQVLYSPRSVSISPFE